MKDKKYEINSEQYESLEHYKNMYREIADNLSELCSDEKDDINMGFELGKIYKYLIDWNMEMSEMLTKIKNG